MQRGGPARRGGRAGRGGHAGKQIASEKEVASAQGVMPAEEILPTAVVASGRGRVGGGGHSDGGGAAGGVGSWPGHARPLTGAFRQGCGGRRVRGRHTGWTPRARHLSSLRGTYTSRYLYILLYLYRPLSFTLLNLCFAAKSPPVYPGGLDDCCQLCCCNSHGFDPNRDPVFASCVGVCDIFTPPFCLSHAFGGRDWWAGCSWGEVEPHRALDDLLCSRVGGSWAGGRRAFDDTLGSLLLWIINYHYLSIVTASRR